MIILNNLRWLRHIPRESCFKMYLAIYIRRYFSLLYLLRMQLEHTLPHKDGIGILREVISALSFFLTPVFLLFTLSYFISFPTLHSTPPICPHYRNSFPDSFLTLISFTLKQCISVISLLLR